MSGAKSCSGDFTIAISQSTTNTPVLVVGGPGESDDPFQFVASLLDISLNPPNPVRAESEFYTHLVGQVCRRTKSLQFDRRHSRVRRLGTGVSRRSQFWVDAIPIRQQLLTVGIDLDRHSYIMSELEEVGGAYWDVLVIGMQWTSSKSGVAVKGLQVATERPARHMQSRMPWARRVLGTPGAPIMTVATISEFQY